MEIKIDGEKIFIIENGQEAFLKFKIEKQTIIVSTTFVPEPMRGKGIAKILNEKLVEIAIAENLKIYPLCSYTQKFLEKRKLTNLISDNF
ncbi:GNAT family N-acetyltransferase [Desulfurobacterium atlanticum]|uniref:N-acetyltransferase domain-containing protein n=1 Tax=Desulfurobacterium atlanticum TaxID=240169 RepID=A0A238YJI4_9BACT|nr:GNAT family N-acetyltransferase [Desulfurobacterium atlanticum]SNR70773.1 hypothetical protein SAMN06265340_103172 [Desulfurobacterium atlanticum]